MPYPTTTRKKTKTPQERKAEAEALHASIVVQVEQLRESGRWARFLAVAGSFHSFSLGNLLLILSQRPDATRVAGFRQWQARGRHVRKGERAITIFGYRERTVTDTDETDDAADAPGAGGRVIRSFPMLSVFDIAQTDLVDGADDPGSLTSDLTGTDDHGIVQALTGHLAVEGWTVQRETLAGGRHGYSDPTDRRVVLGADLSPEHTAKTLIHETAHILLGHTEDLEEYGEHRGLMETEAESVAYVVAGLAGFDTAAYSIGYVAGWSNADTDLIRATATRVLAAVHRIAGILDDSDGVRDDADTVAD